MTATHAANPVNELKVSYLLTHTPSTSLEHQNLMLQITVEYTRTPPLSFVSKLRQFVIDNRDPPGCHVSLHWVEKPQEPPAQQEVGEQQETQRESNNITIMLNNNKRFLLHSVGSSEGI